MKTILSTLALVSLSAFAQEPYRLEGTFTYDSMELVQSRDVEVVPNQNSGRVDELRTDKYTCEYIAKFYRCVKFSSETTIPDRLVEQVKKEFQFELFRFKPSMNDMIITNDAPALTEWDIPDTVKTHKEEISQYHYYLLEGGIHKIKLPLKSEQWLLVHNENKFSSHYMKTLQLDRWRMKEFVILVNFTK
jgi:hypothetical protein